MKDLVMVQAVRMGYFDHKRQREGQQFMMAKEVADKCTWVEVLEEQPVAKKQFATKGRGGVKAPVPNPEPVAPKQDESVI